MANPTITLTLKGKIITFLIRCLGMLLWLYRGRKWQYPVAFEENPRTMKWRDIVYFGYKYYCHPPVKPPVYAKRVICHQPVDGAGDSKRPVVSAITISMGGDLMPYKHITPENTTHLWEETGDFFFSSDIVFANLETPLDITQPPSFVPEVMLNDMHFNTNDETFRIFSGNGQYKGYNVLSVANNHSLDMGEHGLIRTLDHLEAKHIRTVGAARNQYDQEHKTTIIEKQGIKIGFLAYTYSLNQFLPPEGKPWLVNYLPLNMPGVDITIISDQASQLRRAGADIIVCSLHCGNAYQAFPSQHTRDLFYRIFETCGVDIIAGGHPHNLQPWEWYQWHDGVKDRRGFAIYSMADFIAWDIFIWCHLCAMLKITVTKDDRGAVAIRDVEVKPNYMQLDKHGRLRLRDFDRLLKEKHFDASFSSQNIREVLTLERFYKKITMNDAFKSLLGSHQSK